MLSCIRQKAIPIGVLLHRELVLPRLVSECVLEFGFKLIASHCIRQDETWSGAWEESQTLVRSEMR